MDKLKQNVFTYATVAVGVLLLVLTYILVVAPLSELRGMEAKLRTANSKVKKWSDQNEYPSEDYLEILKQKELEAKELFTSAVKVLDDKRDRFNRFFDNKSETPDSITFYSRYNDGLNSESGAEGGTDGLRVRYRKKFNITDDPAAKPEEQIPYVEMVRAEEVNRDAESVIPRAMKQFWVVEAVIETCLKLELRGLKAIKFPKPPREEKGNEDPDLDFSVMPVQVTIDMTYSQIEDFLWALLGDESSKVPFLEPQVATCRKVKEMVAKYKDLVQVREYPSEEAAKSGGAGQAYDALVTEPPLEVTLNLKVLEWRKVKEPPPRAPEVKKPAPRGSSAKARKEAEES